MKGIRRIRGWLAGLLRRERFEREMAEEMAQHLELEIQDRIAAGMSPREARHTARRDFGSMERWKEESRQARGFGFWDAFSQDFRYALRTLRASPGFALVIVAVLAFGIGSSTAIFSAVYGLILRPLPFADAGRLVEVWRNSRQNSFRITPTPAEARLWRARARCFQQVEPWAIASMTLSGRDGASELTVDRITATFPRLIGMSPLLGRSFTEEETTGTGAQVVLLSYGLWRGRFGGDGAVLGTAVRLEGRPYTVVGVLPPGFAPPSLLASRPDAFVPLALTKTRHGLRVAAKLRPGVTMAQANQELASLVSEDPDASDGGSTWRGEVVRPGEFLGSRFKDGVVLLMGAVSALLLIACLNVAGLLLGRGRSRRLESAVRAALGASRGRLLRQMLGESLLLALAGGSGGVVVALGLLKLMRVLRPETLDVLDRISLNVPVLAFALGVSLLTGLIFGLVPALQGSGERALEALRGAARSGDTGTFGRRFRMTLVVIEVALSFALLVGAGLLVRTMERLGNVDPGFRPSGLVAIFLHLPAWKYSDKGSQRAYYNQLADRLRKLPLVQELTQAAGVPPRSAVMFGSGLEVEGGQATAAAESRLFFGNPAGPNYFATLDQPLLAGRSFRREEIRDQAPVWILGEGLARSLFGDVRSALGRRLRFKGSQQWRTVVGVAADVRLNGLSTSEDRLQLYKPLHPSADRILIVRTDFAKELVPEIRRLAAELDTDVPIKRIETVSSMMRSSVARQRFVMALLALFAGVAVGLAAIGLYGVLSYMVVRQRREIGIRMSLGAQPGGILRLVVSRGMRATLLGLAIGLAVAVAGVRLVASQLYGVGRFDPPTYGISALLLATVAFWAAYLPARRASRIDPARAMRTE